MKQKLFFYSALVLTTLFAAVGGKAQTPSFVSQLPVPYTNNFTLFAGANPVFTASANGGAPLYYQWFTNGVAADVATTNDASFTITNVQDSFDAYCVVTNSSGDATSMVWTASVIADPTDPYPQAVLADKPVGYWRLDDLNEDGGDNGQGDDGYVCHDYIGGNDGVYTNVYLDNQGYSPVTDPAETSAQFGETGISFYNSMAMQIQGVDFASSTTTNFTVECWANGYHNSQSTGYAILSKGVYSLNDSIVFDFDSTSEHYFRFYVRSANGTVYQCKQTKKASDGNWHHLVGVCDESAGELYFYIDGQLASSLSIPTTAGEYESDYPMSIGAVQNSSETAAYTLQFYGFINDVAVYNYPLTAAQVSAQFAASGAAPLIVQEPNSSTNANYGGKLVVPVVVTGTTPLSYQWYNTSNQAMPGETNSALVISNILTSTNCYLIVTNNFGTATSSSVGVNVISVAPQIYTDINPTAWAAYVGGSATFSITAYGSAPLYYEWFENGVAIPTATNSSYTATAALGTNLYNCVVSNTYAGGSVASSSFAPLIGAAIPSDPYSQRVLANGPIAYWRLDETNGDIAYDYIGGHDALYTNVQFGASNYSIAYPDTASDFGLLAPTNSFAGEIDNSGEGVPNIDFSTEGNSEFSIEAWVDASSSQVNGAGIVAKGYGGGDEQFDMDIYGGYFRFLVRDSANVLHTCDTTIAPGATWHHLVGVCDEINGLVHFYIDGADVSDASIEGGKSVLASSGAADPAANLVSIGSRSSGASATSFTYQLNGVMSDVAIYGYALTTSQVAADYQLGTGPIINTSPTNIVTSISGNQLTLSWPANHIGWELQVQTNSLSGGLGTNWVGVSGSTTNDQATIPINPTNGCVFYRLMYQP